MKQFFFFSIISFFLSVNYLIGQQFTPIAKNFDRKEYAASNQNWSVAQAPNGIMYFGNNNGLLEFDGSIWRLHKLPQNKLVRALKTDQAGRIYVGSFKEFGYFDTDETGVLHYTSLSARLQTYDMQNDEIWNILAYNNLIIFQSFTSYFVFDGKTVSGHRLPYSFLFFHLFNNQVYTYIQSIGLGRLNFQLASLQAIRDIKFKSPVVSVLAYDKKRALLVTESTGLYLFDGKTAVPFKTDADKELYNAKVNRAIISKDGQILLGTILNGVMAISKSGKSLWTLNSSNVLENNTVLGMFCDDKNNLWLALDKGISMIQLKSSLQYVQEFKPAIGAVYSIAYTPPHIFVGTNQGLFSGSFDISAKKLGNLYLEPNLKGQIWDLSLQNEQIICGNNEETYEVGKGGPRKMSGYKGGMCMKQGLINGQEVLVQGTYNDLCIYLKKNGKWTFSHVVEGFRNLIRYVEIDYTGTIWASHMHEGLFAVKLSPDLRKAVQIKQYKSLDGVNELTINVFSINNRVVFTDRNRFYTYDDINKKIIAHHELNAGLGYFAKAYRVCHFRDNLYWFVRDGEAALFELSPNGPQLIDVVDYSLFLDRTVDQSQNIIPVSNNECMFTLENGLAIYSYQSKAQSVAASSRLYLKSVQTYDAESKQMVFLPIGPKSVPEMPFKRNNVEFTFCYPNFSQLNNLNYRYQLLGLDKIWSLPSASSKKTYNYLPYGNYELKTEVLTQSGIKLGECSYRFKVLPPFYLSPLAKGLYALLIIVVLIGIYLYIIHIIHVKKDKIRVEQEEIRRKEIEKREQQIIALEKEKLETELTLKSKELAESTMTLIKKNEILASIKEEVMSHKNILGPQYPNKYYDKLIKMLDENLSSEADWAIFQTNFDRIHENFFRNLHFRYPELTSNDLRFCAYLRLNLSSKDIAHLMNISLKGVEVGRYRIRKKIGLPSTKSLTEFMIEFK